MTDKADKALLPAGMSDVLAPDAGFEAAVLEQLLAWFAGYGYDRVEPPLIEFEEGFQRAPAELPLTADNFPQAFLFAQ